MVVVVVDVVVMFVVVVEVVLVFVVVVFLFLSDDPYTSLHLAKEIASHLSAIYLRIPSKHQRKPPIPNH